jgi:hypothetical protein
MSGGKLEDNQATQDRGGGIFQQGSGDWTNDFTGVSIRRNAAGAKGGGFCVWGMGISFTECTISDNTAPTANGGVVRVGAGYTATDCTITDDIIANDPVG